MPDVIKPLLGLGVFVVGSVEMAVGYWPRNQNYARAALGVSLMILGMMLSACASGGLTPSTKYHPCVNHDLRDFHGSNAQQDC